MISLISRQFSTIIVRDSPASLLYKKFMQVFEGSVQGGLSASVYDVRHITWADTDDETHIRRYVHIPGLDIIIALSVQSIEPSKDMKIQQFLFVTADPLELNPRIVTRVINAVEERKKLQDQLIELYEKIDRDIRAGDPDSHDPGYSPYKHPGAAETLIRYRKKELREPQILSEHQNAFKQLTQFIDRNAIRWIKGPQLANAHSAISTKDCLKS